MDTNSPYSFLEWRERLPSLVEKDAMEHYNSYVVKWFQKNKQKAVSQKFVLRQKYLYMLDQLQMFFNSDEKNAWYKQVNLADEKELLLAIPYFAKKLKDISLYYLNLRKRLKHTKIKYNAVGSVVGIEQEIYKYLLETFSSKNNELSPLLQTIVPSFSALQHSLAIQVEELYDDKQYFDLSPTQPLSGYFDLLNEATSKFLSTKGIVLSSASWLFNSFDVPVDTSNFATLFSQMTGALFETTDTESYNNFIQKYIAENKYILNFLPQLTSVSVVNLSIGQGNNHFYYPYGTSSSTFSINQQLPLISLSSVNLTNATAGNTLQEADTIIVKYGDTTKAAWLRNIDYQHLSKTVKATIKKDTTTRFIYPFPGYGLSGINLPWTGPSFETNKEYNFLSIELKKDVNQAYWSQDLPVDSCNSILLNNTAIVSGGATANVDSRFADQFYIRNTRSADTTIPYGELQGAWLYKFTKTALPVSPIGDNIFLWPYTKISTNDLYPEYLERIDFSKACNPVPLQELNKSFFVAGSSIATADKIYKVNRFDDASTEALECAWLSASTISLADYRDIVESGIAALTAGGVSGYTFVNQDGFSALFEAGESVRFIWTGAPGTPLDSVFNSPQHRKDCPFITGTPAVSAYDWEKCTCKQVFHAPFGHSFKSLEEGNYVADCVFEVPDHELANFDFGSWRDSTGMKSMSSLQFAWYRTVRSGAHITSRDFTWGGGRWVADRLLGAQPFSLYTGKSYIYKRANSKTKNVKLPPYAVNFNYYTDKTQWVTARLVDSEWVSVSGNFLSEMTFYPGDFVKIDRQPSTTHSLLSASYREAISSNKNSIWSTYDTIPVICGTDNTALIHWPRQQIPFGKVDPQYPVTSFYELSYIRSWAVTLDKTHETHFVDFQDTVVFVPPTAGTYSIAVTAVKMDGSVICIPPSPGLGSKVLSLSTTTYTKSSSAAGLAFANAHDYYGGQGVSYVIDYKTSGTTYVIITFNLGPETLNSQIEANTIIPKISAIPQFEKTSLAALEFQTPTCGFLIEQPLRGWNYNTNKIDNRSYGARPYWATLDTQKTSTTRYKGIYSWGYPDEYIDEYLPNSNPVLSPMEIEYGTVVEYTRKGYPFVWTQPITYQEYVGTRQWCSLSADLTHASNLSSFYDIKQNIDPIVIPTNNPTDIQLSNLVNGAPLEVYYYALNGFGWPVEFITVTDAPTPSLSSYFTADAPWINSSNRFYPTIANVPVIEETYSIKDVGGYFIPQRLGASQFVNKDYDIFIKNNALSGSILTESLNVHIGGRGRTKEDQDTIFDWTENNQWLKESVTTGNLAGSVKKSLTKALQTFIPYQSNIEETALGLVTTRSKFTPWGGINGDEWKDKANEQISFTGVRNVSAWAASQVLKQNEKAIDKWTSDIYGNQYGLFKELDGIPLTEHSSALGELWVRTNSQSVIPANQALSAVYAPFKGLTGVNVFPELTGNQIQIIDCYFDTLFLKTPSITIFAKITYNYETGQIETVFDDIRWKELNTNFQFNKNWFIAGEKKLYNLYTKFENGLFFPQLYELDLSTRNYKQVLETNKTQGEVMFYNTLTSPSLYYNSLLNTFLISYAGTDINDKMFVVDYSVKKENPLVLTKIDVYKDYYNPIAINDPPITLSNYLSTISIGITPFSIAVSAINNPTSFELLNYSNHLSVSLLNGYGVFVGQLSAGLYHVNYKVSNNVGTSLHCLTLSSVNLAPTPLKINATSELSSSNANLNNGSISVTCYKDPNTVIEIAGGNLPVPVRYTVPAEGIITENNLESAVYDVRVIDEYAEMRIVKVIVGYEGVPGISYTIPTSIQGHALNTIFEV